jgi:hypothetical protein
VSQFACLQSLKLNEVHLEPELVVNAFITLGPMLKELIVWCHCHEEPILRKRPEYPWNDQLFSSLLTKCPKLQVLGLLTPYVLKGDCFSNVPESLTEFEASCLSRKAGRHLLKLIERTCRLTRLTLHDPVDIHDTFFDVLSQKCPSLEELDVSRNWQTIYPEDMLFNGLARFSSLKRLTLFGFIHFEDEHLRLISKAPFCRHLEYLHLYVHHVTDDAFLQFSRVCSSLRTIRLSGCSAITDTAVVALVKANQKIAHLEAPPYMTPAVFTEMTKSRIKLTHLDIESCLFRITLGHWKESLLEYARMNETLEEVKVEHRGAVQYFDRETLLTMLQSELQDDANVKEKHGRESV